MPNRTLFGPGALPITGGPTAAQTIRRSLRGGQLPGPGGGGGLYPGRVDPNDFGAQNAMADADVYQAGTYGAANALTNGTGMVLNPDGTTTGAPPAPPTPPTTTTVRPVTGTPTDARALAGLYPPGAGVDQGSRRPSAAPGLYPAGTGMDAALSVDTLRNSFDSDRVFRTQIEPYVPTPGMAPEAAASRFGYLDKLALRAAGVPEAAPGPLSTPDADGWLRGQNASHPVTTPGGEPVRTAPQNLPTETDINRQRVSDLAAQGRTLLQQQNQPQLLTLGKDSGGNPVEGVYQRRTGDFSRIKPEGSYPRQVQAGPRKLLEVAPGKFTDDQGQPVEWKNDQERPLTVNEFLMSPALADKFGNDYSKYREAHSAATRTPNEDGTRRGPGPNGEPAAPPAYKHTDILAEMKRRGLAP